MAMKLTFLSNFCLIVNAAASEYADDTLNDLSLLQTRLGIQSLQDLPARVSQDAARAGTKVKSDENAAHSAILRAVKEHRMVTADLLDGLRSSHNAYLDAMGHSMNSTLEGAAEKTCCQGSLVCAYAGCKISNVIVNFDLLNKATQPNIWEGIADYPSGSMHLVSRQECKDYDSCYEHFGDKWTLPLLGSTTYEYVEPEFVPHWGTSFMVIRDNNNIFHQMGSVIASLEALQHFGVEQAEQAIFCDGEDSSSTNPLWNPLLAKFSNRKSYLSGSLKFSDLIIPRNARAHWWWNVWDEDNTDHSVFFQTLRSRVVRQYVPDTKQVDLITVIDRAHRKSRMVYNLPALIVALKKGFPQYIVESHDFSNLEWKQQLRQVRLSKVLMSSHGAGLVWGIFLPKGSIMMELLGKGQSNNYFVNQASWRRDIKYLKWQNLGGELEEKSEDSDKDFHNNINVNCDEVVDTLKLWLL